MTALQTPTQRDEEWRYADFDAVGRFAPADFDSWTDVEIAAGQTHRECFVIDGSDPLLQRIRVKVAAGARAEFFAVIAAADYARLEIQVDLEDGAHFEFGGILIGGGDVTREFVTRTVHGAPSGTSNQVVRAVHWGQATGNFLGRIDVARAGQQTDAAQDFKGLLLEKGASANAKPELEIYADDVKCAHGATVGQLDEMARYYMGSRGLSPDVAQRLLIRAFIADALAQLDDTAEQDRLFNAALAVLGDAP